MFMLRSGISRQIGRCMRQCLAVRCESTYVPSPLDPKISKFVRPEFTLDHISGDVEKDGLTIYDMEFLETAEWVKDMLLKMQEAGTNPPSGKCGPQMDECIRASQCAWW